MVGVVTGVLHMQTAVLLSRLSLEGYRGSPPGSQGQVLNIHKSCNIVAVTSERSSKAERRSGCPRDCDSENNSNNFLLQKFIRFPSAARLIPPHPAPAWPPPAAPQSSSHPSILSPEEFTAVEDILSLWLGAAGASLPVRAHQHTCVFVPIYTCLGINNPQLLLLSEYNRSLCL